MPLKKIADGLEYAVTPIARAVDQVGVALLGVMMLLTAADVIFRYVFNSPIKGSIEITGFLLLATIFWSIPYAQVQKRHITIELFIKRLSSRRQLAVETMALFISLILVGIFVWRSIMYALDLHEMNRYTGVLELQVAPFILIITIGCLLFFFVLLVDLLRKMDDGLEKGRQAVKWIFTGIVILAVIYFIYKYSRDLPWSPSPMVIGLVGLGLLFAVFLSKLSIFMSLTLVGFLGMCFLRGPMAGLGLMDSAPFSVGSQYTFSVIPLFVLMGTLCFYSGLGKDLYDAAYSWVGSLPGGLAMGTIVACGGFAAVCGDTMATAVTMGTLTIPEMKRYRYNPSLAAGCVAAGGTLGVLIPPSLAFILYAILTDQSIAVLFIAGIVPGILLVLLFMFSIYIRARLNPALGPAGPRTTLKEKFRILSGVWATLALFVLVIGGMYAGMFTPTEGGGIGAFGALVIGLGRRRLNWKQILSSLVDAGRISGVCFGILVGANIFGYFLAASKLPMTLAGYVTQMAVPPLVVLILILLIYLFLGCLMPAIPMLVLTVPIFYPLIMSLGFNPIWYGVIMVIMFEMAVITPPMGINVLALQSVSRDIDLGVMFKGVLPFLFVMIICLAILIAFPDLTLFLPNLFGIKGL